MVSIIIPTYNRSQFLIEAVESCIRQSYKHLEVIIVDDGSTDNTQTTVRKLLRTTWSRQNIRYFFRKNEGASAARNFGLSMSRGEYVQFLDSDDLLHPNKINYQVGQLKNSCYDVSLCYGSMGTSLKESDLQDIGDYSENNIDQLYKLCSGDVHVVQTSAPLWRKIALLQKWNALIAFGDDLEFHVRTFVGISRIIIEEKSLFFVRQHSVNRLSDLSLNYNQIESAITTWKSIVSVLSKSDLWDGKFQKGVLKNVRTIYFNALSSSSNSEINSYEKWLISIAKSPGYNWRIIIIVYSRKLIGKGFVKFCYQLYACLSNKRALAVK